MLNAPNGCLVEEELAKRIGMTFQQRQQPVSAASAYTSEYHTAQAIYDFVIKHPVDWATTPLTAELIKELLCATKAQYPFLSELSLNRLGHHFAYLNK